MVVLLLANGFEEVEALTVVDVLRRRNIDIRTVSVTMEKLVTGTHGIQVMADLTANDVILKELDMLILPGGMPGSLNLDASQITDTLISAVIRNGGRIAAICAAPLILGRRGLLDGKEATCYPGFENELKGAKTSEKPVVTDGNITTAKGMGVALEFALELVRITLGEKTANEIADSVMKA